MRRKPYIVVVEDEHSEREALARVLRMEDYEVAMAEGAEEALTHVETDVDLVLSDLRMGRNSGIDLLRMWKEKQPATPFVLVTAHGDVESAVEAMKLGATDYVTKPVNPDELLILIRRCLEVQRKDKTIEHLSQRLDEKLGLERIVGRSKPMLEVFSRIRRAAQAESTILILGESGTGKELVAEAIHQNSRRKSGPFVAVNMAAVPASLVESELFGHVRGAFTGATASRMGRFEAANGGTIFIDEIGDFALESQAKLLRVLETHAITPVGGNEEVECDVRVVAATSRDLEELIAEESFREDLYYRLTVVTIPVPPLRERSEDIPLLVNHFLRELCQANNKPTMAPDRELMRFFETFDWPGNVRQLANCIESMVVMAPGPTLTPADLPANLAALHRDEGAQVRIPIGTTIEDLERQAIQQTLERFDGNRTQAAEALGISVRTLQRKLKGWDSNNGGEE